MSSVLQRVRFRRDHRWAPRQMSAYLDGELGASGAERIERHAGECEECRGLLAGLRAMLAALHRLPDPEGEVDVVGLAASVRVRLRDPPAS